MSNNTNKKDKKKILIKCKICNYETDRQYNMDKHLNTEKHAENKVKKDIIKKQINDNDGIVCIYCNKFFQHKNNINRHYEVCKKKEVFERDIIINNLKKELNATKKELNDIRKESLIINTKLASELDEARDKLLESATHILIKEKQELDKKRKRIEKRKNRYQNTTSTIVANTIYDNNAFYDDNMITKYLNKNVLYIGYIGIHNNEHLFKFGLSTRIFGRDHLEHQRTFDKFILHHVIECDNHTKVEELFKKEMFAKKLLRNLQVNNKFQTELFTITTTQTLDNIKDMLETLVNNNELPQLTEYKKRIIELERNHELEILKQKVRLAELQNAL